MLEVEAIEYSESFSLTFGNSDPLKVKARVKRHSKAHISGYENSKYKSISLLLQCTTSFWKVPILLHTEANERVILSLAASQFSSLFCSNKSSNRLSSVFGVSQGSHYYL